MTLTFSKFSLSNLMPQWRELPASPAPDPNPRTDADEARQDRAFALEMMDHNPEAVQSELGLMMLMARWPMHL